MRQRTQIAAVSGLLAALVMSLATAVTAAPAERYLHVNVENPSEGQSVHVNVPLSMAEKILPAINNGDLHNGKVVIHDKQMNAAELRAVLEAVRTTPDNQFVTVEDKDSDVRVAKFGGKIVVHVTDKRNREQNVDVTVPVKVVDALVATEKDDQLDLSAALRALSEAGDIVLVTVQDSSQKVRIWVDSRNAQD